MNTQQAPALTAAEVRRLCVWKMRYQLIAAGPRTICAARQLFVQGGLYGQSRRPVLAEDDERIDRLATCPERKKEAAPWGGHTLPPKRTGGITFVVYPYSQFLAIVHAGYHHPRRFYTPGIIQECRGHDDTRRGGDDGSRTRRPDPGLSP